MTYDDIDRDIFASLGLHFQTVLSLPVFFEKRHIDKKPALDYVEIRIDGPIIDEIANSQYVVEVEVDLKIVREKTDDFFAIRRDVGKCAESLRKGIPYLHPAADTAVFVTGQSYPYCDFKTGETYLDGTGLNETVAVSNPAGVLGCLETQGFGGKRHKIETRHYGQLTDKQVLVATVSTTLSILL